MGVRPFRWFPVDGRRHAIPDELAMTDEGATLCGIGITVPRGRGTKAEWCWPTCVICDSRWREREGTAAPDHSVYKGRERSGTSL